MKIVPHAEPQGGEEVIRPPLRGRCVLLHDELPGHLLRVDIAPEEVGAGLARCGEGVGLRRRASDGILREDGILNLGCLVDREVVRDAVIFVVEVHRHLCSGRHRDRARVKGNVLCNEIDGHALVARTTRGRGRHRLVSSRRCRDLGRSRRHRGRGWRHCPCWGSRWLGGIVAGRGAPSDENARPRHNKCHEKHAL